MAKHTKRTHVAASRRHKEVAAPQHAPHQPLIEVEKHGNTTWINVQDGRLSEIGQIADHYGIHALHVHPTLSNGQVSQIAIEDNYLFVLLCQPYSVTGHDKISTSPIGVYLGKNFLITVHSAKTPVPKVLFDELKAKPTAEINSSARIVFHLISRLLADIQTQTEAISGDLDKVEGKVFDYSNSDAIEIGRLRQKIIRLRRSLAAQKTVLEELHESIDKFSHEDLRRYYVSNTNFSRRLWETIEEAKETVEVYKDADFTASTERTNQILAILTIIFTLAIPGTLVGTFYGMNIKIPGSLTSHAWNFLGEYTTFWLVLGFSVLAAVLMFIWFKKRKWF